MKPQIFHVHGGNTFKNQQDYLKYLKTRKISTARRIRWNQDYLYKNLAKDYEIISPRMPLQDNAKYCEWKIYFERFFPYLRNNITLIGGSLGGIFLAKYLSENKFPKKIKKVILIAPPYDDTLPHEDLAGGFKLKKDLSLLEEQAGEIYLLFSKTDKVVPLSQAKKYQVSLPSAEVIIYPDKNGHFQIEKFPEIIKMITNDPSKTS